MGRVQEPSLLLMPMQVPATPGTKYMKGAHSFCCGTSGVLPFILPEGIWACACGHTARSAPAGGEHAMQTRGRALGWGLPG